MARARLCTGTRKDGRRDPILLGQIWASVRLKLYAECVQRIGAHSRQAGMQVGRQAGTQKCVRTVDDVIGCFLDVPHFVCVWGEWVFGGGCFWGGCLRVGI